MAPQIIFKFWIHNLVFSQDFFKTFFICSWYRFLGHLSRDWLPFRKKNTRSEEVSAFGKRRCRCNYKMGLEATSFCLVAIYKYLLGWVSGFSFSFYQSFHQSDKSKTKEDSTLDLLACFSYIFISGKNVVIAAVCLNNMTYGKSRSNRFI